jgi:hypothetical protein
MEKKRIGIVTYWRSEDNYGQILQCYALQTFLKSLNYDVFLIKDISTNIGIKEKISKFIICLSVEKIFHFFRYKIQEYYSREINKLHKRNFADFKYKYITFTEKEYTIEMLRENPPKADVYICGSDQIWRDASPIYFLDFGNNVKRISYAASFGMRDNNDKFYFKKISTWLKCFDTITVREQIGINICKKAGRDDAICVPDPTLLLTKSDYIQISKSIDIPTNGYIFLYLLGNYTSIDIKSIYKIARIEKLEVIYVASQGRIDKYPKIYPTIEQWIFLINNARHIITNSYHGAIFSILMNKQFHVLPLKGNIYSGMNDRLNTLFNDYQLPSNLYSTDINSIKSDIDYDEINLKLAEKRRWIKKQMKIWLEKSNIS